MAYATLFSIKGKYVSKSLELTVGFDLVSVSGLCLIFNIKWPGVFSINRILKANKYH